ncbi:MAG: PilZ domain-containing protein [Nitrospirota bacterium]
MEDKRRHERIPVLFKITVTGDLDVGEGTTRNLSESGCAISTTAPVPQGTTLTLRIYVDDDAPIKIDQAVVRWSSGNEFGLEFLNTRPDEQDRLTHLLHRLR